jgi:hypothetical protein
LLRRKLPIHHLFLTSKCVEKGIDAGIAIRIVILRSGVFLPFRPLALFTLSLAAASSVEPILPELREAAAQITADHLLRHIKELSADAYEGRLPGTSGEKKSVAYIISQCEAIGLQPGSPNGGWTQTVPLWGTLSHGTLHLLAGGKSIALTPGQDYVAWSVLPDKEINVPAADLVFVGYGTVAPEYRWNDYAGVDVHGKIVISSTAILPSLILTIPENSTNICSWGVP